MCCWSRTGTSGFRRAAATEGKVTESHVFQGHDVVAIPSLTTDQMRQVDRAMVEDYGIQLIQMMENAGRGLAHLARTRFLLGNPQGRRALVLVGKGGNGGGGMVCARRLSGWGGEVALFTTVPASEFRGVAEVQLKTLQAMEVPVYYGLDGASLPSADLVVDAIIGYGLHGAPEGGADALIRAANSHGAPVLSLDVPSGLDATTGRVNGPAIRAVATLTLALPKTGLHAQEAAPYVGELYLAGIGVPPRLYASPALGLTVGPIFTKEETVRLR